MDNFELALDWALQQTVSGNPVISDAFFTPLTNRQRKKLRSKLVKKGLYIWPLGDVDGNGAIMIRKDAPGTKFLKRNGLVVGHQTSVQGDMMFFGSSQFDDLIGKM